MANSQPASLHTSDRDNNPSFLRNVKAKASHYHAHIPYLQKLPFPAIAIIVTLIVVNLLVWAAVGIVLVQWTLAVREHELT